MAYAYHSRNIVETLLRGNHDCLIERGFMEVYSDEAVFFGVPGDYESGHELGDVILCFGRKGVLRYLPEVVDLIFVYGGLDPVFPAVIAGGGELPGLKHGVQVAQIIRGGHRGLLRVHSLVHPDVDPEPVASGGRLYELPGADCGFVGFRFDAESAFDHSEIYEIGRHTPLRKDFLHQGDIFARALEPYAERPAPFVLKIDHVVDDPVVQNDRYFFFRIGGHVGELIEYVLNVIVGSPALHLRIENEEARPCVFDGLVSRILVDYLDLGVDFGILVTDTRNGRT